MKVSRPTWIPVVAAMITKEDQILLGQRPEGSSIPGVWEFPGGKIEPNEAPTEALQRELKEELGIQANVGPLLLASAHTYGDVSILLLIYHIQYWTSDPKALHHTQIKWVPAQDLQKYDLPYANKKIIPTLLSIIKDL